MTTFDFNKSYNLIYNLIKDLWDAISEEENSKATELYTYFVLIEKLKVYTDKGEEDGTSSTLLDPQNTKIKKKMEIIVNSFGKFIEKRRMCLKDMSYILEDDVIQFNDKIYFQIGKYSRKDPEITEAIRLHLFGIAKELSPGEDTEEGSVDASVDTDTAVKLPKSKEGNFVQSVLDNVSKVLSEKDIVNSNKSINETTMEIMSSGVVSDILKQVKETMENEDFDINSLMNIISNLNSSIIILDTS